MSNSFFVVSRVFQNDCKHLQFGQLPDWERDHLCEICTRCVIGEDTGRSANEVSQKSFLSYLSDEFSKHDEYLCAYGLDYDEISLYYSDLEEEILRGDFHDKEYVLELT